MQSTALTKQNGSSILPNLKLYVRNRSDKVKTLLTSPGVSIDAHDVRWKSMDASLDRGKRKGPAIRKLPAHHFFGRCERIRTFDPLHPMQVRYQAAPHTDKIG